jgi:hypothetical protein
MDYQIKGLKTFNGMEGGGYECSIYRGKLKIGTAMNDANGGCDFFHFINKEEEPAFEKAVSAWYETSQSKTEWENWCKENSMSLDVRVQHKMESWVSETMSGLEEQKRLKRLSKTKTLFRLKGDEDGVWRTFNQVGQKVIDHAIKKYGDQLEQIYGAQLPPILGTATTVPGALSF